MKWHTNTSFRKILCKDRTIIFLIEFDIEIYSRDSILLLV